MVCFSGFSKAPIFQVGVVVLFTLLAKDASAAGYAIVTSADIRASSLKLADFAAHKAARGYDVHVFDENDWGGSGLVGDAAAEAMRTFLQSAKPQYNLDYVLIVGDPRTSQGPVPMKTLMPRNPGSMGYSPNGNCVDCNFSQDPIPSDYYYAELDGNWDLDGDGNYGEFGQHDAVGSSTGDFGTGGIETDHDLLLGRIPVYSNPNNNQQFAQGVDNLDHILQKTIDYQSFQNAADIAWRQSALLAAEGGNRLFYGEQIRDDFLQPLGFDDYRVYDYSGSTLQDPPDATTCSIANVVDGWNTLQPGLVTWLTHGSGSGATAVMNTTAAATLPDEHPVITWQASCNNSSPNNTNNLSYALLVNGAVATVGATAISHGPGSPVDLTLDNNLMGNAGMGYGFLARIATDGLTVGEALMEHRRDSTLYGRCWYWQNAVTFNLYGDPEISLMGLQEIAVPEPTTLSILLIGVAWLTFTARTRRGRRA